jgi:hypothetical protein
LPSDFEQYDPKVKEEIERTGALINGTKTFEWLIVSAVSRRKEDPGDGVLLFRCQSAPVCYPEDE